MAYLPHPTHYTTSEFRARLAGLTFAKGWRPAFPTLHNTGNPSLATWMAYGAVPQERWGASLERYYQGLGWHAGPHLVVCPDYVWQLCDLEADGVSVSCWNHETIGIEMVGDYNDGCDDFASGEGAKVRDNAVFVLAALCEKLGWNIAETLHFHRECARDRHACPGARVSKGDIVQRVNARLEGWGAPRAAPAAAAPRPAPPAPEDAIVTVADAQRALIRLGYSCGPAGADGDCGRLTEAAIQSFRFEHGLPVGDLDQALKTALEKALSRR